MDREKLVDYLDKQFWKHKTTELCRDMEHTYETIPRESLYKIIDGLIPLIKSEIKKDKPDSLSLPDIRNQMTPIKNLIAMLEKADNIFYVNDNTKNIMLTEIENSKKAIKNICKS